MVIGAEKPKPVLHEITAHVHATIELIALRGHGRGRGRPVCKGLVAGVERAWALETERVALVLIAAGLGDCVDLSAGHPPVLCGKSAGLDLDLLDEVEVEQLTLRPVLNVRRVEAVDEVLILSPRRAIDGHARRVGVGARCDLGRCDVVARQRERFHRLAGDVCAAGDRVDVDHGSGTANRDRLRHCLRESHLHRQRLAEADLKIGLRDCRKAAEGCLQRVSSRRELVEAEPAVRVRDIDLCSLQVWGAELNGDAGKGRAASIRDLSFNCSRRRRLRERRRGDEDAQSDQERDMNLSCEHFVLLLCFFC